MHSDNHSDAALIQESVQADISRVLQTLTDRQREVLILHFGLTGKYFRIHESDNDRREYLEKMRQMKSKFTLTDIAIFCDLSIERIGQIKTEAIRQLRKDTENEYLRYKKRPFLMKNRKRLLQSHYIE